MQHGDENKNKTDGHKSTDVMHFIHNLQKQQKYLDAWHILTVLP